MKHLTSKKTLAITAIIVASIILILTTILLKQTQDNNIIHLRGSGATFLQPQLEAWIQEYTKENKNVIIEYQGIGSGAGQEQFFKNLTDFCGSDPPLSRERWLSYKDRILQLPVILGAVAVVYNIPELPEGTNLKLSGEVIAEIYMGEIRYWDDTRIKELNPTISEYLPHKEIMVVHRSDASGTTQIFTTFLYKASPEKWQTSLVGKTISWPVDQTGRGIGAKGNPGVTAVIKNTPYSIGYVELAFAIKEKLEVASIKNREGNFVLPSKTTIQSAAKHALNTGLIPGSPQEDFSTELEAIILAPGKDSYPLTSFSHIFVWKSYEDKKKAEEIAKFLNWIYTTGSNYILEGYVAVPEEIKIIGLEASKILKQ